MERWNEEKTRQKQNASHCKHDNLNKRIQATDKKQYHSWEDPFLITVLQSTAAQYNSTTHVTTTIAQMYVSFIQSSS